tara:strand:+ start:423 stop:1478 length:1056 start_codon:yes stop_codon:yes gene_type:complete
MENYKDVVGEFKRIADNELWNRVDDSFLIGVRDPADKEIYWCSLMGKDEELYGVSMYKGASGLYSYDYIRKKDGQRPDPEMATVQDTILVTLDEEEIFSEAHGDFIKSVEESEYVEGMHIIPMRMQPGITASICNENEMHTASEIMAKLADFLLQTNQDDYFPAGPEILLLPDDQAQLENWETYRTDKASQLPDPAAGLKLPVDESLKRTVGSLEVKGTIWEAHVCYYPFAISSGSKGGYYPQMLLIINKDKGELIHHIGFEKIEYSHEIMLSEISYACSTAGYIPCEIEVRRPDLKLLLSDLFENTGIDVNHVGELVAVRDCLANIIAQVMNRQFNDGEEDCCSAGTCGS